MALMKDYKLWVYAGAMFTVPVRARTKSEAKSKAHRMVQDCLRLPRSGMISVSKIQEVDDIRGDTPMNEYEGES